ncbi:MAG: TIGR03619 family F420-dependent LLM class oxidoreductase [Microthrixaceae bacterium]
MTVAQFSIRIPNVVENPDDGRSPDWRTSIELARIADRVGVDRIVVSDHILLGEQLDAYGDPAMGGTLGGRQPTSPDGHWLEPLTMLSVLAALTERVRLGTAILLAALRPPALLAKQAATLDVLSGGRLDLGVGVGWQREEYEACGLNFEDRGRLLDRCLELCDRLWSERSVDVVDGDLRFDQVHQMPKPLQPNGVPIWVSGRANPRVIARTARFGVGWIPWGDDAIDPEPGIDAIRSLLAQMGRDPHSLQVQGRLPVVESGGRIDIDSTMAAVPALVSKGITDFRLYGQLVGDPEADEALLGDLVEAFRATVGRQES